MNGKRIAIATVIGLLCGLFCAHGTSTLEDQNFVATTGLLVAIVYNRVLIGFVVGIGEDIKIHPILRGNAHRSGDNDGDEHIYDR